MTLKIIYMEGSIEYSSVRYAAINGSKDYLSVEYTNGMKEHIMLGNQDPALNKPNSLIPREIYIEGDLVYNKFGITESSVYKATPGHGDFKKWK
ncbi:MAG: hypothetical protein RBS76_04690 [Acholeplasmatales bacterium]|jgi:hypothetical protein|nr:hypothetical protein [Acholeplasmataceae bacterium]MCK9234650.1 hypothetical protein [Acholeplasmataceae bacterium]MCK9428129.1 hypothetical protein [Acholeplasmataceae bacterium]MDY0115777.1 hypothetical protein [Acholeplasmatales bacterium]HHT39288.1 hypothetical protein [Acholeplasmataceae bacterium]